MSDSAVNQIRLEPVSISHAALISEAEKRIFTSPWSENDILRLCEEMCCTATRVIGFCAYLGDSFSGYATMYCVAGEGQINNIAVLPQFRRKGVGNALLTELCGAARRAELDVMFLEVRRSNFAAMSLYEKHGFVRIGERRGFYTAPVEDAILLKRQLK
ncbi:Ribosomal-protein-alanine acetyltransferase [bioreactor metagenome]|uniref:Ribosomal-protein-alanine acetyltransferase n=1 Tax=bioreactor metagenome TaxID=1076179 RepID=A0A645G605_9ZZZZ|nr:ribosomal protein S18-alanine N-acetyltransferase [Oscillospiraceae bacterium]